MRFVLKFFLSLHCETNQVRNDLTRYAVRLRDGCKGDIAL